MVEQYSAASRGRGWERGPAPALANGTGITSVYSATAFHSISCPSTTTCLALADNNALVTLTFDGVTLNYTNIQVINGAQMVDLACQTTTLCVAVGGTLGSAVIVPVTIAGTNVSIGTPTFTTGMGMLEALDEAEPGRCLEVPSADSHEAGYGGLHPQISPCNRGVLLLGCVIP